MNVETKKIEITARLMTTEPGSQERVNEIMEALRTAAFGHFPRMERGEFDVALSSIEGAVCLRLLHLNMLIDAPWVAVVSLTEEWSTRGGRRQIRLRSVEDIVASYIEMIAQGQALGVIPSGAYYALAE
jgi:hypothetical protein